MRRGAPLGLIADIIQNFTNRILSGHNQPGITRRVPEFFKFILKKSDKSNYLKKQALSRGGYTVVEVMLFLAITAALFAMIVAVFAGQRGRAQFSTSSREMESRLQDIANDVSTGFYPSTGSFSCREQSGAPNIESSSADQGTNEDCVYLGRVIHFNVGGDPGHYNVYSVVGLRQFDGRDPVDYTEAEPTTDQILVSDERLPGGMEIGYVRTGGPSGSDIEAVGYFSSLGSLDTSGMSLESGSLSVNVISIVGSGGSSSSGAQMISHINDDIDQGYVDTNSNPDEGITICINSTSSDQHAILTTGGNERQLTTDIEIGSGSC